jgi:hypothetical protein
MTTAPMNGDEDRPVTRRELKAELAEFKAELKAEFRAEFPTKQEMRSEIASAMAYVVAAIGGQFERMREDMAVMRRELREELSVELAGHVRAAAEDNRRFLATLDDKYRDLPGRVTVLERELDEHRRDTALHPPRRRR